MAKPPIPALPARSSSAQFIRSLLPGKALRIASARRSALDAKGGAHRGLPDVGEDLKPSHRRFGRHGEPLVSSHDVLEVTGLKTDGVQPDGQRRGKNTDYGLARLWNWTLFAIRTYFRNRITSTNSQAHRWCFPESRVKKGHCPSPQKTVSVLVPPPRHANLCFFF